jgi:hypothetical protein
LQQFGGSLGGPIVSHHTWFFADYEQQKQKNPISVVNPAFADLSQTDFQVPASVQLPAPNGSFPVPGSIGAPDPSNPIYLQQVSNAVRRKHTLKFGAEFTRAHVTDLAFGGFDPDAQAQNGTFRGTYSFSSFTIFALGIYDNFFQSTGQPKFSFNVPYVGFYLQNSYQVRPRRPLTLRCAKISRSIRSRRKTRRSR